MELQSPKKERNGPKSSLAQEKSKDVKVVELQRLERGCCFAAFDGNRNDGQHSRLTPLQISLASLDKDLG
jgi:hypothetical protein